MPLGVEHRAGWDYKIKAPKAVPVWERRDAITSVWDRGSILCPPKGYFKAGGVQRINMAVKKIQGIVISACGFCNALGCCRFAGFEYTTEL